MSSSRVALFFIIVILIVTISDISARKNGRKRKQQSNRQLEDSLQSEHSFDAIHHTYGSSLFEISSQEIRDSGAGHHCQPINIETCRDIGYNVTSMPNFVGQESQTDAELQLQTFVPLISYGCASQLRFFLCSVYTPMCTEKVPVSIGPCRPLCESVRARCAPVLLELGFVWPDALNCSKFVPENTVDHMCMEGPPPSVHEEFDSFVPSPNHVAPSHKPSINFDMLDSDYKSNNAIHDNANHNGHNNIIDFDRIPEMSDENPLHVNQLSPVIVIPNRKVQSKVTEQVDLTDSKWAKQIRSCIHYRQSELYAWLPMHPDGGRCVAKCVADIRFSNTSKRSIEYWTTIWASLATCSCLFTLLVFVFSKNITFKYPERPIIYISICSIIYAITYIYRSIIGRDIMSCVSTLDQLLLVQRAEFNPHCTLSFLMLYYFGMANAAWFLVLSGTWASAYALRTPLTELANRRGLYHAFAWIVPALQTLWVLVTRAVDADELTGICFVGNQDTESLLHFVLMPMALYLSVSIALFGLALLFPCFIHVCSVDCNHCCIGSVELSDRGSEQNSEPDSNSTGCSDFCRRSNNRSLSESREPQQNLLQTSQSGQSLLLVPGPYTATLSSTASYNSSKSIEQRTRIHPTLFGESKSQTQINRFRLRSSCVSPFESTYDPTNVDSGVLQRAGIFALFYIIPTLFVLASIIYEYDKRDGWLLKRSSELVESIFQHSPNTNSDVRKVKLDDGNEAYGVIESADSFLLSNFDIFRLRLFMSLLIGMSTGIWIVITRGQIELFCCRHFLKKTSFKSTSSSSVALTGSAHMQLLSNNINNVSFPSNKASMADQTESHFFTNFFPPHSTSQLTQQQSYHHQSHHHRHDNQLTNSAILQHCHIQNHNSQHTHHFQRSLPCVENVHSTHHVKPFQQLSTFSNHTTPTSVSSGHAFAYPNPNLLLDNHWGEHSSNASYRTGNETAV